MEYRQARHVVREFIQQHYSDSDLVFALDKCRNGTMQFMSCCCLIGIPTRDHEDIKEPMYFDSGHWHESMVKYGELADTAQTAFHQLLPNHEFELDDSYEHDARRRLRLIPILKAEIRRRIKQRALEAFNERTKVSESRVQREPSRA